MALSTSSTVASCTWPTTSRRSEGFNTGTGVSVLEAQPSIGAAFQLLWALASRAQDKDARRCSLAMSMPLELARSLPYRSRGSGMRGCGRPKPPSSVAICSIWFTGSATSSWMEMDWSAIRLTNEVFAPFSSRRRTRYASRVSWVPTGAYTRHGRFSLPSDTLPTTCSYSGSPMPCRHWNSYWPG
ncbi:hypothetical protein D3C78_1416890 [compost metagenome]